ncbi:hypothetical protein SAMN06265348_10636 [Pedobacter westerhofensis]|uniref:RiboL-PSP-HEPN domain-containing protein n=1 Tax=Pedobacter westerhofensis TaxID=425512 RepID=A0A521DQ41_9SPHI|nr:hypothetical protein [Pedobacter westerhofensis]SMO73231.1 hypothetical protein SAMN06265348_10636 [Pedobacter westerhofensis]
MGYWKQLMIDSHEDEEGNAIADALGISYFELRKTDYQIEENVSDEGVLYNYRIVFSAGSPKETLNKIEGLHGNSVDIATEVLQGEYAQDWDYEYDYEYDAISSSPGLSDNFDLEIEKLRKLNEVDLKNDELNAILKRQIYIGVMGTMETFLSETFVKLALANPVNLEKFVKSNPEFANRKFDLKDVFEAYKNIEQTAKGVMLDTIYHNLPVVREMYRSTFEIGFPEIKEPIQCVKMRHDLVHRNGKTKDGTAHVLDSDTIDSTIATVRELVGGIVAEIDAKEDLEIDFSGL